MLKTNDYKAQCKSYELGLRKFELRIENNNKSLSTDLQTMIQFNQRIF